MKVIIALFVVLSVSLVFAQDTGSTGGGIVLPTGTPSPTTEAPETIAPTPAPTFSSNQTEGNGQAFAGEKPVPPKARSGKCKNVNFSYTDFWQGAESPYCCPHRESPIIITDSFCQEPIGKVKITDSPDGFGVRAEIEPSRLRLGHIITMWIMVYKEGTCTGDGLLAEADAQPECSKTDLSAPENSYGLLATGVVGPDVCKPFVLSSYTQVPNNQLGLVSTEGYEFHIRFVDQGLPPSNAGLSQDEFTKEFSRAWTSEQYGCTRTQGPMSNSQQFELNEAGICSNLWHLRARFPARKAAVDPMQKEKEPASTCIVGTGRGSTELATGLTNLAPELCCGVPPMDPTMDRVKAWQCYPLSDGITADECYDGLNSSPIFPNPFAFEQAYNVCWDLLINPFADPFYCWNTPPIVETCSGQTPCPTDPNADWASRCSA